MNLDRLQHWIDQGRLHSTPEKPITAKELLLSGCVHNVHDGIKLLGNVRFFIAQVVFHCMLMVEFAGCGILEGSRAHYPFSCIEECHSSHRSQRRHRVLPIL